MGRNEKPWTVKLKNISRQKHLVILILMRLKDHEAHSGRISPTFRLARKSLLLLQLLVLPLAVPFRDQDENHCQSAPGNDSTTTSLIVWLLVSEKEIRCEPMGDGGDAISNRDQSSSFGTWPRYDGRLPRYLKLFQSVNTRNL